MEIAEFIVCLHFDLGPLALLHSNRQLYFRSINLLNDLRLLVCVGILVENVAVFYERRGEPPSNGVIISNCTEEKNAPIKSEREK